ncbi:MAG TPA: inositol monophosphatase family protein [Propionibacteriaceae bacterium]|nr:inositol monophosphatase family protein [Propionibacteriaceae bacterium]
MEPMAPAIPANLRELALTAARSGAGAIAEVLRRGGMQTDTKQASHDLVTSADRASEQAVLEVLRSARPDDAVLGEETGEHPGTTGVRWFVDPLDGTANFIYGRAGWAVSVGAELDARPTVGAVVCPADGRWAAADPGGVDAGGYDALPGLVAVPRPPRPLGSLPSVPTSAALVSLGQPYPLQTRADVLGIAALLVLRVRAIRMTGAAASELLGLAGGESDAFLGFGLSPWDTTAGAAIVRACGGTTQLVRSPIGVDVLVAAMSAELADELTGWVAETGPS